MSRNGSGVYSLPAGNPVVTGTTISSSWANTTLSDIATALTGSVAADGQTAMTGNLQMANNKITGLAVASASGDALSFGQAATISALTVSGTFAANGGATLGDGSGDALTINSSAVSAPNGLNFNSDALVLNTSGNLGLAITPSAWSAGRPALEFGGSVQGNIAFNGNNGNGGSITANAFFNGSNWVYKNSTAAAMYQNAGATHAWFSAGSGTAGNAITFTQAMTLDASGNLMVGATSTDERLRVQSSASYQISFKNNSASGLGAIGLDGDNNFLFYGNNTERMRIDSSGNLLVGATSAVGLGLTLFPAATMVFNNNAAASGHLFHSFRRSGVEIGYIDQNGTTAVRYITSSDYRLKDNVAPMTGALDKVALLKPVTYKWKIDGSDGQGFIAHELAEVCPEAVSGEKDAVDENGSIKPQGIDTSFLVATLTAAIQEQQAIITDLKARIESLETK
jgi:hypothetical protein